MDPDKAKKILGPVAVMHTFEAIIAWRAAKKRGKSPALYFFLTLFLGVFVLVPLLRKPKI